MRTLFGIVLVVSSVAACSSPTVVPPDANDLDTGPRDSGSGDGGGPIDVGIDAASAPDMGLDAGFDATACDGTCTTADPCPTDCAVCVPDSVADCYTGPAGTEDVGLCAGGTQTCLAGGAAYGPCVGEIVPTADDCATAADEDCDGVASACGSTITAVGFGGAGDDRVYDVAARGGRVVIVGSFSGSVDFGGGPLTSAGATDVFVAVFDAGVLAWARHFGDAAMQNATSVALDDTGGVVVVGNAAGTIDFGGGPLTTAGGGDVFVARFAADSTLSFAHVYGDGAAQAAWGVAVNASGITVVGQFAGAVDFGGGALTSAGATDAFVARFAPSGTHTFSRRFGDAATQRALSVAYGPTGNAFVVGSFVGSIDFGTGPLTSAGASDVFVVALDPTGSALWAHRAGNPVEQVAVDVAVSSSGDVVVGGSFAGNIDFGGGVLTSAGANDAFVAQYDAAGAHVRSWRFGDGTSQDALGVATDAGDVFVGGQFTGSIDVGLGPLVSAGGVDAFVASLAPGSTRYGARYGDAAAQSVAALAVDGPTLVVVGNFAGTIDLGGGPLTSAGMNDLFVATMRR